VKGDGSNRINFGDFVQGFDVKRGEVSPSKHHLHEDNDRDGKKVDTLYKRSQSMLSIFHYMDTMDSETSEKVKEADWVKGCEQLRQGMSDSDKQHLAGAEALFAILDFDGSGEINLNKFLEGCRIVLKDGTVEHPLDFVDPSMIHAIGQQMKRMTSDIGMDQESTHETAPISHNSTL